MLPMGAARLCWTRFFLARYVQLGAKQLYDRTSPLRLPATTDCFIYLLTEKASFASKADAPRKNWLKFPHNEVVKMMETMPSLGAQLDFYARTLQHPRLAPWSLERGLVNVYRRTGSILMMPDCQDAKCVKTNLKNSQKNNNGKAVGSWGRRLLFYPNSLYRHSYSFYGLFLLSEKLWKIECYLPRFFAGTFNSEIFPKKSRSLAAGFSYLHRIKIRANYSTS